MLSFALSTGTNLATSFFHLPFDEEEDNDIENYERKYITWDPDAASSSNAGGNTTPSTTLEKGKKKSTERSTETSPSTSRPGSPSSSNASLFSPCSSSGSISSMSSAGTSVSGVSTTTGHSRSASEPLAHASTSKLKSSPPHQPTSSSGKPYPPRSASSPTSRSTSPKPTSRAQPKATSSPSASNPPDDSLIRDILRDNDLYSILGLSNKGLHDKLTLRRAYLARSRLCHPDKFPSNPDATQAFQKVSVAYNVLSTPDLKRRYDEHIAHVQRSGSASSSSSSAPGSTAEYDVFASARPSGYAEDTLRSVILGVFNDFLDNGDLEVVRNLLKAINDMNPGVKIGEDGVKTVLSTLHSIRERALTCRTCIYTLHNEITRLLEVQHAFSQLSYFDILGRTRMAVQISRIAVGLPVVLEKALVGEREEKARLSGARAAYVDADGRVRRKAARPRGGGAGCGTCGNGAGVRGGGGCEGGGEACGVTGEAEVEGVFPRHVMLIVRGVDVALERMERILK
ncbi:hypothetical protein D9611_001439 [Ephemerocybe angulata]|uniref:J domain-containing protein n=1 Tax=Ephemerocybe angulata TaxID=980116 RepID=A0A8H5CHY5_9AGAR|nr:hypothetical protein D9611_001439 [Tulosesus angulatus]